jgi:hypothetical protein
LTSFFVTLARRLNAKTNAVGTHFVRKKIKKGLAFGQPPRIVFLVQSINKKQ